MCLKRRWFSTRGEGVVDGRYLRDLRRKEREGILE